MNRANSSWKRDTTLFLAGQAISFFGSMLVQYAIAWHITLSTQSGTMMTISILCGFLPTFVLSPFAGVWADRYNRKALIVLADAGIALATLVLAVLFMTGHRELWMLFVALGVRALGSAVQNPAVAAMVPQFVPADRLAQVNATYGTVQSVITLISPMLSGALLSMARIETVFFIDVITAAMAITVLLTLVKVPTHAKAAGAQALGYFDDMRAGIRYIMGHRFIKAYCLFNAAFFILVAPAACMTPLQITRSFGGDVWRLTAAEIAFSSGMMVGGVAMASWGGFKNKMHSMALSNALIGLSTFALGITPVFWTYLAFMGLAGLCIPLFNTPATVLLQQRVEGDYLGRVFGVMGMITSLTLPLSMLVFGPLADVIRIESLFIVTGLGMIVVGIMMLGSKVLMEAGRPAAQAAAMAPAAPAVSVAPVAQAVPSVD
ncbi:MAG: enterobactin exporter EntS [Firmicutes bacterium ADurb.Bin506]|jgi:DHA3 family macrolide efflux protein-like MFS transporter|nr:MAG: enterobactin exporter EntS [Firmicutes bacterium ADurb.Bin506]